MRSNPGAAMACLLRLWGVEDPDVDQMAGAYRISEFMHLVCEVLTKKK